MDFLFNTPPERLITIPTKSMIHDIQETKSFLEFLEPTRNDEVYAFMILERHKDLAQKNKSRVSLFKATSHPEENSKLITDIMRIGSINAGITSTLYIRTSPRCLKVASITFVKETLDILSHPGAKYDPSKYNSCIQKSKSRTTCITFDIDIDKNADIDVDQVADNIRLLFNNNRDRKKCATLISTKGGFHLIVKPSVVKDALYDFVPNWIPSLTSNINNIKGVTVDQVGDIDSPIPGTIQRNEHNVYMVWVV